MNYSLHYSETTDTRHSKPDKLKVLVYNTVLSIQYVYTSTFSLSGLEWYTSE